MSFMTIHLGEPVRGIHESHGKGEIVKVEASNEGYAKLIPSNVTCCRSPWTVSYALQDGGCVGEKGSGNTRVHPPANRPQ
jgi:hypothetical protein